jgi:hypothetical protein
MRLITSLLLAGTAFAQTPLGPAPGETAITTVHAEGIQLYECRADQAGRLAWAFREPVATLLRDGQTVGRHYAGPHWEFADGGLLRGTVAARAPGATAADIPHLRLDIAERRAVGEMASTTAILRLRTVGGALEGPCERAGAFRAMPYTSDYVFLRRAPG